MGDSQAKVRAMIFPLPPQCRGSVRVLTLGSLLQVAFSVIWGGDELIITIRVSLQGEAYTRALRMKSH